MGFFLLQTTISNTLSPRVYHPDREMDPSVIIFLIVATGIFASVVFVLVRAWARNRKPSDGTPISNTVRGSSNPVLPQNGKEKVPIVFQPQPTQKESPKQDQPTTERKSSLPPKLNVTTGAQATPVPKPSVPLEIPKGRTEGMPERIDLPPRPKDILNPTPPIVEDQSSIIFTTLNPAGWVQQPEPWVYPMVRYPRVQTVIQRPREYHKALRGHTEAGFQSMIENYFGATFTISGNHALPTSASSRPYEPDISMISRKQGANLFLDIEIDEPYAAIKRNPMHCAGEDDMRDVFFNDRGWIVIRFTEKQVATAKTNCLAFIAKAIKRLDTNFEIPSALIGLADPPQESQWTTLQAQKWEKEKHREGYLGIAAFGKVVIPVNDVALVLNEKEKEIEKKVKPSVVYKAEGASTFPANVANAHARDQRIQFIPETHTYLIDGIKAASATNLIESVFPIFDSEYQAARKSQRTGISAATYVKEWADKGKLSADLGTKLHAEIERYYHLGTRGNSDDFQQFLAFAAEHPNIKVHRSEWRIFDEDALVAGTIDLLSNNADGTFDMYDWKRSGKVIHAATGSPIVEDEWGKTGIGVLSSIADTSCNRYFLQQNVYKLILEANYPIKVRNMNLVVIHPDLDRYHKISVPIWTDQAKLLLQTAY